MSDFWLWLLTTMVYTAGALLMAALRARIPPPGLRFPDMVWSLFWPVELPIMVLAALIRETYRSVAKPDGTFAGLWKDRDGYKKLDDGRAG